MIDLTKTNVEVRVNMDLSLEFFILFDEEFYNHAEAVDINDVIRRTIMSKLKDIDLIDFTDLDWTEVKRKGEDIE